MADPELAKEVARQGHTVGTHTWSHRNMSTLTPLHARAEIDLGFSAVRKCCRSTHRTILSLPVSGSR